jgi:hypothetical protein
MGHLMEAFTRNARGGISIRRFDSEQFPGASEGWYDSPSKVPLRPGQTAEPVAVAPRASQAEATISSNLGTNESRPLGSPRKPGRPRGSRNAQ